MILIEKTRRCNSRTEVGSSRNAVLIFMCSVKTLEHFDLNFVFHGLKGEQW